MRILPLVIVLTLAGCAELGGMGMSNEEFNAAIASVKETRLAVTAELEKAKIEIAKSGLSPEQRAAWEAKLQNASDFLVKVEAAEARLDKVKEAAATGDPGAVIASGGAAAAPLGGPYAPLIAIGSTLIGGIVTGVWKQRQIAASHEAIGTLAALESGGLVTIPAEAKAILNTLQSDRAKRQVQVAKQRFAVAMTAAANTPGRK